MFSDSGSTPPRLETDGAGSGARSPGIGQGPASTRQGIPGVWTGRLVASVVTLALMTATAGCTDGDEPSEPAGVPSSLAAPSQSPADPAAEAEQAALAAYRGMWGAYDRAGQPPAADPDHPDLARYAVGDALEMLTDLLGSFRDDGLVFSGELVLAPQVTELSPESRPGSARVEDCVDSSGWGVVRADGEPHEDDPGGRRLIFADVEDGEGEWVVSALSIGSVGTC